MAHTRIRVVDSHTAGEPTRVVIDGGPDLGGGPLPERRERFRREFDRFRSAIVNEPRGSDPVVGALLCPPLDPTSAAGVIFFNNVGYLGMCGHGTIGVIATLAWLGRIGTGTHRLDTPVGTIVTELHESGDVALTNVPAYRFLKDVRVDVEGIGPVTGDVAWGGNWFFLVKSMKRQLSVGEVVDLTDITWRIRQALARNNITGKDSGEIDHVELFGPPVRPDADSRNFVLCPGRAYDRSPCGTGTCAKMACLFEDGMLKEGETWRQESIVGGLFEGSVRKVNGALLPTIRGRAFVNAESTLILNDEDPFCYGIRNEK